MTETIRKHGSTLGVGILFLLIGLFFLFGRLQILPVPFDIHQWWPIILILIGLLALAKRRSLFCFHGWLLILLGVGFLFTENNLYGITWDNLWEFWPVLLVFLGLSIIFDRSKNETRFSHHEWERCVQGDLQERVVMGSLEKEIASDDFRGGSVEVVLGSAELDLRPARIKGDSASLKLRSVMSHVEIRVSSDWRIEMDPRSVMGSVQNDARGSALESAKRLCISAEAVMGSILIRN